MAAVLVCMLPLLHSTQQASVNASICALLCFQILFCTAFKVCHWKINCNCWADSGAQIAMMKEVAVGCKISVW